MLKKPNHTNWYKLWTLHHQRFSIAWKQTHDPLPQRSQYHRMFAWRLTLLAVDSFLLLCRQGPEDDLRPPFPGMTWDSESDLLGMASRSVTWCWVEVVDSSERQLWKPRMPPEELEAGWCSIMGPPPWTIWQIIHLGDFWSDFFRDCLGDFLMNISAHVAVLVTFLWLKRPLKCLGKINLKWGAEWWEKTTRRRGYQAGWGRPIAVWDPHKPDSVKRLLAQKKKYRCW